MVGPAAGLLDAPPLPEGVSVREAGAGGDLRTDLVGLVALQELVFGNGRSSTLERVEDEVRTGTAGYWLAESGDAIVAAGSLRPVPGTSFAGIWGGCVHPDWRGRGIYRATVAARARVALERGIEFIHSDSTAMSRPILERSGLVAVTTTTPYVWKRPA